MAGLDKEGVNACRRATGEEAEDKVPCKDVAKFQSSGAVLRLGLWWRKGLPATTMPPLLPPLLLAPGRIIYFSNTGREAAASSQALPVSTGSSKCGGAGAPAQGAQGAGEAGGQERTCWPCHSSGGWEW